MSFAVFSAIAKFRTLSAHFLLVAVIVSAVLLAGGCRNSGSEQDVPKKQFPEAGEKAPELPLLALDGTRTTLAEQIEGKVALLDVWATWCAPCLAAVPHLKAWHNRFEDSGFTVIGLMTDINAEKIGAEYMKKKEIDYPQFLDNDGDTLREHWGSYTGIPLMVLIDRQGTVDSVYTGTTDIAAIEGRIEELMAEGGEPAASSAAQSAGEEESTGDAQ